MRVALSRGGTRLRGLSQPIRSPLESGNHPSIGGSWAHCFVRLSRGHSLFRGTRARRPGPEFQWMLSPEPLRSGDRHLGATSFPPLLRPGSTLPRVSWGRRPPWFATPPARWTRSAAQWSTSPGLASCLHPEAPGSAGRSGRPLPSRSPWSRRTLEDRLQRVARVPVQPFSPRVRFTSAFIHSPLCVCTQSDEFRITTPSPQ